jgi:phosphoribosylformylglycinamidine cyclo-ligase
MEDRGSAYKNAGVDLQAAGSLVERIKKLASKTHTRGVLRDIGLFAGMFRPDLSDYRKPVLVSSADGVGTKLKLAFDMDRHDTVGIDLVAMNVNDIVVHGAKPLFFLDYFASGRLDVEQAEQVVSGMAEGCRQAQCALLGGETAEMPGFYSPGEYDLSGFCVGMVDYDRIVDGSGIGVGNRIIGLASDGLHSNGLSLVRKLVSESGLSLRDELPGSGEALGDVLLKPTRIYVRSVLNLLRDFDIKGMVHITGGGFYDNLPRILPRGVRAGIDFGAWSKEPVFHWLKETGDLSWQEMLQVFNCGLGMVLVVGKNECDDVLLRLKGLKERAWVVGEITQRKKNQDGVAIDV